MTPFDDLQLDDLLSAPAWTDAHECFQESQHSSKRKRPYGGLYEVLPLWLFARTCLEEEEMDNNAPDTLYSKRQAAIDRLPRGILARIFDHLSSSSCSSPWSDRINPYSWLSITLVCRHWRNTAYAHPSLWTAINLKYERDVIRSLLILSENKALHVYLDTFDTELGASGVSSVGELAIKLDLVMDEQARIEGLEMHLNSAKFVKLVPWKQFTSHSCSQLTNLRLRGPPSTKTVKPETRCLPAFVENNMPHLRQLILDGLHPAWADTDLPFLTQLELKNLEIGDHGPGDFVQFLSRCRELQSLKISSLIMSSYTER